MSNKQKDSKWQKLKKEFYGTKTCVQSEYGTIDFDPDSMGDVVGGDKLTYDEYLDILMRSGKNVRGWFEMCYFETALEFAASIPMAVARCVFPTPLEPIKIIFVSSEYMSAVCLWMENALMLMNLLHQMMGTV